MYSQTTRNIKVTVYPAYLDLQSDPEARHYVWAYSVQLDNIGEEKVQLLNRRWHITDATGAVQEVRGTGVIGEQPVLEPGDTFRYTSGAALRTTSGIMTGEYEMETEFKERFLIKIPVFSLDSPEQMKRPN
ncbi:MAG: Co2+/Mg2+ efflux protein ApaG [Pseudomonadota bacterium]